MNAADLKVLLRSTRLVVRHREEKEKLKGERFNIFSILRMERSENFTHSAFLFELLNPKGSHLMGTLFLRLFLQTIDKGDILNPESSFVKTEMYIGKRDDVLEQGGRVDIYLRDSNFRTICIENKIFAGDQIKQIVRYCNHNKGKNTVFYLTLFGAEPSIESKGNLISGKDFYIISYQRQIQEWLNLCLKETVDTPILRETIRQYILLIKKLTGTMENKEEKELHQAMLNHFEESSYIASNFEIVKQKFTESIRQEVISKLSEKYKDGHFLIKGGNTTKDNFSQIWIILKDKPDSHLHFGIESFSGKGNLNGQLFVGVYNGSDFEYPEDADSSISQWWPKTFHFNVFDSLKCNLGDKETIARLHQDSSLRSRFIDYIITEVDTFLNEEYPMLINFLSNHK